MLPCLFKRYDGPNSPIYACTGINHACHFISTLWHSWKQGFFKKYSKKTWQIESLVLRTIWYIICEKSHTVLNNINSKCSSSVCPQGHGLYRFESGVLCMLLALSFFPSMSFFEIFSNWKGMICTLKVCSKNIGHYSHSRAKDNHTSLPGLFTVKQYHVLGICQCLFALWFYMHYRMRSAMLRNHLKGIWWS